MSVLTFKDAVDFVIKHRKGNAFKGYNEHQIISGMKLASDNDTLLYATNDNGELCGIITAFADYKTNIMHIHDFLATEKWVMPLFVRLFKKKWPEFNLEGRRKGKYMKYNTTRFCSLVTKGGC